MGRVVGGGRRKASAAPRLLLPVSSTLGGRFESWRWGLRLGVGEAARWTGGVWVCLGVCNCSELCDACLWDAAAWNKCLQRGSSGAGVPALRWAWAGAVRELRVLDLRAGGAVRGGGGQRLVRVPPAAGAPLPAPAPSPGPVSTPHSGPENFRAGVVSRWIFAS